MQFKVSKFSSGGPRGDSGINEPSALPDPLKTNRATFSCLHQDIYKVYEFLRLLWFFFDLTLTSEIKSLSTVTSGMPTPRRCRTLLCHSLIVTLHARLFNTLSSQSLMEIGSFSKHNDDLCWVKGALSARTFSSFCPTAERGHLLSPSHQTVTAACLPVLSLPASPINQQIRAVTAALCFARVNSLKWILTGLPREYVSY